MIVGPPIVIALPPPASLVVDRVIVLFVFVVQLSFDVGEGSDRTFDEAILKSYGQNSVIPVVHLSTRWGTALV